MPLSLLREWFDLPKMMSSGNASDRRRKPTRATRSRKVGPASSNAPSIAKTLQVLIVEDDPYSREILKDTLEHAGHLTHAAARRGDAIRMLGRGLRPDIILLDLMMPGMSAEEFCSRLKEMDLASVPVVAISAADEGEVATPSGAIARMSKPIDIAELLASINKSAKKKR